MPSIYIETSIVSYLTAWPMHNLIAAAHQALTRDWWDQRREHFELFASELVIQEASQGDTDAARRRLEALTGVAILSATPDVQSIAVELFRSGLVPANAAADAAHIAFASVYRIDFLLTWNCKHIANAERLPAIKQFLSARGMFVPNVCTPEELMGDVDSLNQESA